jgi:hypothetical protein
MDINKWLGVPERANAWLEDIEGDNRAVHFTNFIINNKPVDITIVRNGVKLDPQTVRLEMTRIQPDRDLGRSAREAVGNFVVVGDTDFDVKAGDKFSYGGARFEVRMVYVDTPGIIQAWCEIVE